MVPVITSVLCSSALPIFSDIESLSILIFQSTAGLQESQAHQPAARKISRHDKTVVEESRATVGAQEKSHEVDVPQAAVAFSELLQIEDIDSADRDNPQLCAEYVAEIYQYMMQLEVSISLLILKCRAETIIQ